MQFLIMTVGIVPLALFAYLIYLKLQIYKRRTVLQDETNLILKNVNLSVVTLLELVLWIAPIWRFRKLEDQEHRQLLRKADLSLVVMFATAISIIVLS